MLVLCGWFQKDVSEFEGKKATTKIALWDAIALNCMGIDCWLNKLSLYHYYLFLNEVGPRFGKTEILL